MFDARIMDFPMNECEFVQNDTSRTRMSRAG